MNNSKPTQCQRLLAYMDSHSEVTQIEALNSLGILRLASRISELKTQGYQISKKNKKVTNRFGESCTVAAYSLDEGKDE